MDINYIINDLKLTIGVDFSKIINFANKKIKLQIWDFGGEERFRFLLHQYCKNARGGLFVFNIADSSSIDHIDDWLSVIRQAVGTEVFFPILVVGLLPDDENIREVSTEEGAKIARSRNLNGYIECDLKTGKNVNEVFENLTRLILADNSRGRNKRELKKTIRSQLLEKDSKIGDMNRLLDGFQIPEELNKEEQPQLSDEDIRILDLESEEGVKLIKQYQKETNRNALWRGKETPDFNKWLKGEKVETRDLKENDNFRSILENIEFILKSSKTNENFDFVLENLTKVLLRYSKNYYIDLDNIFEKIKKWEDYDEDKYPYSEILKLFSGNNEYWEEFLRNARKWRYKDRDRYPYPHVFKPPEPPDDFEPAPQSQLRVPLKEKDPEEEIYCQYCGRELTKEEQSTHSCKKKP